MELNNLQDFLIIDRQIFLFQIASPAVVAAHAPVLAAPALAHAW